MKFPRLVPGGLEVYKWSLERRSFTVAEVARELGCSLVKSQEIVTNLLALQLARRSGWREGRFVPTDPSIASSTVLAQVELDLLDRQSDVNELRSDLERVSAIFRASRSAGRGAAASDIVVDVETVRSLLREVATNSTSEVVSVQPGGGRSLQELAEARGRDLQMLARGVRMRVLYQHTARFDVATREHAELLIGSGAEIRTAEALFGRMIIFDRATAFIPAERDDNGTAAVIQDPTLVAFLYSCFEHVWASAKEFDTRRYEVDAISGELKSEIVRMLIAGAKDDTIARRLGLSVRTTRKHIAQLMQKFGASSRFQFGYAVKKEKFFDEDL